MNYIKERKEHFRIAELIHSKGKMANSSISLLIMTLMWAFSCAVYSAEDTSFEETLKNQVAKHLKQEVAVIANSQQWGNYLLTYDIWIPGAANYLPDCPTHLVITGKDYQPLPVGNLKRSVSCEDLNSPWRINVTIKSVLNLPVVVAKTTLRRDETIQASDLKIEKRTLTRQEDFYTNTQQVIGLETTRRIRSGQIVSPNILRSSPLVEKGNEVMIIASKDGFTATTKGIALEQGGKGQQIEVQNSASGKVIRAVVTDLNQVHTQF
ncbi:flagellar basal body P-ring formation protein FlgA [Vibrio mimicus]